MHVFIALATGFGVALTSPGCLRVSERVESGTRYVVTGHAGGAYKPKNVDKYDLENEHRFVLLDKGVERSVTLAGVQERVNDDGRLEVVVNLRNRINRRIEVQANCVFKNDKGFPTNDDAPFQTMILTENAQEGVRFVSLNDEARAYTVRVRQAR